VVILQPPPPPGPNWERRARELFEIANQMVVSFSEYVQSIAIPGIPFPDELKKCGETMVALGAELDARRKAYAIEERQRDVGPSESTPR
jgi:hypothetical protein